MDAIPRVNKITTPLINQTISTRFGLPLVSSSHAFKSEYVKKREELRRVNGKDLNFQNKREEIRSSTFIYSTDNGKHFLLLLTFTDHTISHLGLADISHVQESAGRTQASYEDQIAELQKRLHNVTAQIELSNGEHVKKDQKLENQACYE